MVRDSCFVFQGFGLHPSILHRGCSCFLFRVSGFGFRVSEFKGFRVSCLGFRVSPHHPAQEMRSASEFRKLSRVRSNQNPTGNVPKVYILDYVLGTTPIVSYGLSRHSRISGEDGIVVLEEICRGHMLLRFGLGFRVQGLGFRV